MPWNDLADPGFHPKSAADPDVEAPGDADRGEASGAAPCAPQPAGGRDRWLIRLDGILLADGAAREGAAALLRALAGRYVLVSSNSRDTARTMAAKLKRFGLDVPEAAIVLAGEEALRLAAARFPGGRCLVMASRVLAHAARDLGMEPVQDKADVILLGRDSAWNYRDLLLVANEMAHGCRLVVSNGDLRHAGKGGRIIPDTGALLAAIVATIGDGARDIVHLPRDSVLRIALGRLGVDAGRVWLLSDAHNAQQDLALVAGLAPFPRPADGRGHLVAIARMAAADAVAIGAAG